MTYTLPIHPTPAPVKRDAIDPNSVPETFPDPSLREDTVFHGGSGKTPPPDATPKTSKKMSTDVLKANAGPDTQSHGRQVHDGHGSVDHAPGNLGIGVQSAPEVSKAAAPVRNDLKGARE